MTVNTTDQTATLTITGTDSQATTVNWSTLYGSVTNGDLNRDKTFNAGNGTVTVSKFQSAQVVVRLNNTGLHMQEESFYVVLSGISRGVYGQRIATVTIKPQWVDVDVDGIDPAELPAPPAGAIVGLNNGFSKEQASLAPQANPNDPAPFVPNYSPDPATGQYEFDPQFFKHYIPAIVEVPKGLTDDDDVELVFPASILVWNITDGLEDPQLVTSGTPFTPEGTEVDLLVEGISASVAIGQNQLHAIVIDRGTATQVVQAQTPVTVVSVGSAVDGNRNGTMDFDNSDDDKLLFWYNNTDKNAFDLPSVNSSSDDLSPPDGSQANLQPTTDLENFGSFHLLIGASAIQLAQASGYTVQIGLSYTGGNDLVLRFYRQAGGSASNADNYTSDTSLVQLTGAFATPVVTLDQSGTVVSNFLTPPSYVPMIFDAWSPDGQMRTQTVTLTTTITVTGPNGSRQTISHDVTLDLRSITKFFDRYSIPANTDLLNKVNFASLAAAALPPSVPIDTATYSNTVKSEKFFNTSQVVVLVHGWNMTTANKINFAETMLKRLYWQGYSGQFIEFDWPDFVDAQYGAVVGGVNIGSTINVPILGETPVSGTFDPSEYEAWRSGQSLETLLAKLDGKGLAVSLFAHSQGNIVAAEALRLWSVDHTDALVSSYVAMQAAVSAGLYGQDPGGGPWTDIALPSASSDLYRYWPDGTTGASSQPYMAGARSASNRWVNMYNPQDKATSKAWVADNWAKNGLSSIPRDMWPYSYQVVGGLYLRETTLGNVFTAVPLDQGIKDGNGLPGPSAYEAMAFLSRASVGAVGTRAVPGWFQENLNVSQLMGDKDPGDGRQHSFQFYYDVTTTYAFYNELRRESGISSTLTP